MWFFRPMEEKTYTLRPTLDFWPIQTPGCDKSKLALTVVGMGCEGFIEVQLFMCVCKWVSVLK